MLQALSAAGGQGDTPIINGQEIAASMSHAKGIDSVSFVNASVSAINGQIRISAVNDFLSPADRRGFVTFTQRAGSGGTSTGGINSGGTCVININRDNGHRMLQLLSPEISDYLEIFMAPIITREVISKAEYLDQVAGFYNRTISNEIASSRIRASLDFPGTIQSVTGGTFSGRRAVFEVMLVDLFVLEQPMRFEVVWN